MRVISLLPSSTEILCALGALPHLVGVSHECDYPPAVRGLPRVTSSTIDGQRPAAEVDREVLDRSAQGEPLCTLDADLIAALAPELVLTQAVCDVCAVGESDVRRLAEHVTPVPAVLSLGASTGRWTATPS